MIDPLSVAGLSLAVLEQLIKVGERTAQLVADAKSFEEDSTNYYNLIQNENTRTKLLKALLFSEASTLFEQFDMDIQKQIELFLRQLNNILSEGCDLLERRYGIVDSSSLAPSSGSSVNLSRESTLTSRSELRLARSRSNTPLSNLLVWSFRDKKRVESIIRDFNDQNSRINEQIKLWCLASQLGINVEHLKHLQTDTAAKALGFDKDATLRLSQTEAPGTSDLELKDPTWSSSLKTITPIAHQGLFSMFVKDGKQMLQENHPYEKPQPVSLSASAETKELDSRTRKRIESLARLLHQPKEQIFRIPSCMGWKFLPDASALAFVFEIEPPPEAGPVSLLRLVNSPNMSRPELGDKYLLAMNLARCISQLHMVQWVHESFRSENIIFFPKGGNYSDLEIPFDKPWVLGFALSRPENFFSSGPEDFFPARDIYRHPRRQGRPEMPFSKIHDIYAFGVVLLEIGLWEPAIQLEKNMFAHAKTGEAVQEQLIKHAERRLKSRVGRKYQDIVIKCLTGNFGVVDDNKEDLNLQQAFRTQVVDVLERAAENV